VDEDDRLWVLDGCRVLMWSTAPLTSFAEASQVVGSADFTSIPCTCNGPLTFRASVASFAPIAARGGRLLIPTGCQRVMIWNPVPTASGAAAQTALGQANFYDSSTGNGAADLNMPGGVWTDGTRVAVADVQNHRVLIWTSFPLTNKQPADIVLGQQGFGTSGFPSTPTGATMRGPFSVYSDGVKLFVSDTGNNRVLVWHAFPTANGQPADFAIGQPDLTSDGEGHGPSQLSLPRSVTTIGDHLFVADMGNNRVLVFSPIPVASGAAASLVLGQATFDTTSAGAAPDKLSGPAGLAVGGNKLYVTDFYNNRVLRFDLRL
jgi:hypothetical protein